MNQTIQISQTKFDELINRISRLEEMMGKILENVKAEKSKQKEEYPTFHASDRTLKLADEAMKHKDTSTVVEDIDEFFDNL